MANDRVDDVLPGEDEDDGKFLGDGLAAQMSELARLLQAEEDETAILTRMVTAAVDMIPGVEEASIMVVQSRKKVEARAPSGELARQVDALQEKVGQGPCLDAVFEHKTVSVPDMSAEQRWPRFAEEALALGAASMLSFQLFVEGDNLGAFNLYSRQADAFDEESEQIGLLVAAHASVVFAGTQKIDQMRDAAESRDLIGQAKGILMERYKVTGAQAFLLLVQASSRSNTKLIRVAGHLADTGNLPPDGNQPLSR